MNGEITFTGWLATVIMAFALYGFVHMCAEVAQLVF